MWHTKDLEEIKKSLKYDINIGLSEEKVKERLEKYGENILKQKKKESFFIKFIKQFNDFMIITLIVASIVSALVTKFQGSNDYIDSIIIIVIVVLNAIMGLLQEEKAEKSIEALKKLTSPQAKVRRDGKIKVIDAKCVVPGDIILLEAGNYVVADARLISSSNLKVEESSLTGETISVLKDEKLILPQKVSLGDMKNMVFSNTIVVNGHGEAIVTATGMNTKVGQIADMINTDISPKTPIQKKLTEVSKSLGISCLVICIIIFIIGVFKKISPIQMFMTSVGLAVAAIPEGLPAVVTIMLSIGVTAMSKKNSIVRKLPAVETLGSSSIICSDKTGTLTKNEMEVKEIFAINDNQFIKNSVLEFACLCTDCEIDNEKNVIGEPTEVAIVKKALEKGFENLKKQKRVKDIPFDSNRKMMSVVIKDDNSYKVIVKGAPDVLIKKCDKYFDGIKEQDLTSEKIRLIEDKNSKMAKGALRVIAVAYKKINSIDNRNLEEKLVFAGLIGMVDPPREGVKEAIKVCKKAGIKTVMITGDHIDTAKAIALELGILNNNDLAITGEELDRLDEDSFRKNILKYSVFARVSPEHKVRIVKAYRSTGAVVAMTGDGVNDSPALKIADIGIAMGKNGTDVAKNAADMVLTDDNFVTIVEAVKQGRNIYDNIKKAIHFLIATNVGEIVTIFFGLVLGMESPLLAIQLLWINLVTDSFPAIALGLGRIDEDIMNKKPRDPKKGIFSDGLWSKIFFEGIMIGSLTLLVFSIGNKLYGIEIARTMTFLSLGILELIHSFNIKSGKSIFKSNILDNIYLIISFVLGTFMQVVITLIPSVARIFGVVTLDNKQLIIVVLVSIMPIIIVEIQKKFEELKFGKVIQAKKVDIAGKFNTFNIHKNIM